MRLGVAALAEQAKSLPLSEFVARHGRWFLVLQANPDDPASADEATILPVRHAESHGRNAAVTIGSDRGCDIVLDESGVAPVHANLHDLRKPMEWPTLHVYRPETSYSVGVDQLDVVPGGRAQLFNGTRLRLGSVALDVVSALAMHAWLRRYS